MDMFEELFKTRAQGAVKDVTKIMKVAQKAPSKTSLIEQNKAKNLAITLRKGGMTPSDICTAIETYVPQCSCFNYSFLSHVLHSFSPRDL